MTCEFIFQTTWLITDVAYIIIKGMFCLVLKRVK